MREIIIRCIVGCILGVAPLVIGIIIGGALMDAIYQKNDARMDQRCP